MARKSIVAGRSSCRYKKGRCRGFGSAAAFSKEPTYNSVYASLAISSRYGRCGKMVVMAKTRRRLKRRIGRQAPPGVWTPQELRDAITRPSREEKMKMLREIGILDARGKLARKYRSWGTRVSRTQNAD